MRHIFFALLITPLFCLSQNIGIGTTSPDPSAALEIKSNSSGVLIPRLTIVQRDGIPSPSVGLMIYNSDKNEFEYYNGSLWVPVNSSSIIADADNDTRIETELETDNDDIIMVINNEEAFLFDSSSINQTRNISFLNSRGNIRLSAPSSLSTIEENAYNISIGHQTNGISTGKQNISIGYEAGRTIGEGSGNVNIGHYAARSSSAHANINIGENAGYETTGNYNINIGYNAGAKSDGTWNTLIGDFAGEIGSGIMNVMVGRESGQGSQGDYNVYIGRRAGEFSGSGSGNVFVGEYAGKAVQGDNNAFLGRNTVGGLGGFNNISRNTYAGSYAGYNAPGSDNVFLGYKAGHDELGSNKLYIANDSTDTPLIYGEFDDALLDVNGSFTINNLSSSNPFQVIQDGKINLVLTKASGLSVGSDDIPPAQGLLVKNLSGTSASVLKADANGAIYRADSEMSYKSIGHLSFVDDPDSREVGGDLGSKLLATDSWVWAELDLPHGSTLDRIELKLKGAAGDGFNISLFKKPIDSNTPQFLLSYAGVGFANTVSTGFLVDLDLEIDLQQYTYFIRVSTQDFPNNSDNFHIYGARLHFYP